jgi:FtsH-binding integral membrane protein
MKKTILTFGLISGVLISLMMAATIPFADRIGFDRGEYVGYTTMVLAFLLVFFGIRSFRDNSGGGAITFVRGFAVGISITLISCVFYVVTWEVLYFNFLPGFMDKYAAYAVAKLQASGASAAAIQAQLQQLKQLKVMYDNPLTNAAMTFLEPLPVGLVITLLSAAVLRRKPQPQSAQSTLPATS